MCLEFVTTIALPIATLLIALVALYISFSSRHYAEKAVGLALFEKRYNLYYEFKLLLSQLLNNDVKLLPERLAKIKYLLWEAQYIYGQDAYNILERLKKGIGATILYYSVADEMAEGQKREDLELITKYKSEGYDVLNTLPAELLSDDDSKNLNHYFHKYLNDNAFKKPL